VRNDLLQGTLDLLILRTLATAPLHGWDIAKRIAEGERDDRGQRKTRATTARLLLSKVDIRSIPDPSALLCHLRGSR
jgi:hypothetical protein